MPAPMRSITCLLGAMLAVAATGQVAHSAPRKAAPKPSAARKSAPKTTVRGKKAPVPKHEPVPAQPQFLRDVAPLLDRFGCSVAACHGKFGGRGDLEVSLLTLAPEDDYRPIVLGSRGRRVNLQEPEESLLLQKAAALIPHAGGQRFKKDSAPYRTLLNWIRNGAPFAEQDPRLQEVTVEPRSLVLKVGQKAQLKVTARWSDGRVDDVTRTAMYASSDEPVALVNDGGQVSGVRWGGTGIQVRFLGIARAAFVTIPQERRERGYPALTANNVVDERVFEHLRRMNVLPSELSSDEQFCRRVYLDTIGVLPTPEELDRFLQSQDADKRRKLIDELLERPEYVDLRTLRLADMLRVNPRKISNNQGFGERSAVLFHEWIRENVASNRPYNEFVRDLLASRGSLYFNGPASYWAIERTANDRAETTGQAFLGVRLGCARCHKHPFDRWNTDHYWNFSVFHGKVALRNVPGGAFGEQEVYYNPDARVLNQSVNGPRRGLPAIPTFLGSEPMSEDDQRSDISMALANWVVGKENPFFSRATMNRLWAQFFGRAPVEPVDDMRETTPESVPGLLDALSEAFIASGYDIKHMTRLLLNSRTYQFSSTPNASNQLDDRFYSRYYAKPMLAQVLLDAINQATGTPERLTAFPLTRSVELPIPTNSYFLTVFGQSHRLYLADLDPKLEPNLVQTLHMMNSSYINQKIRGGSFLRELTRSKAADDEILRLMFSRTLCRRPTSEELTAAARTLSQAKNRQEGLEDILWSLMSSREFLFIS